MRQPLATSGLYQPEKRAVARVYKPLYEEPLSRRESKAPKMEEHAAKMRSRIGIGLNSQETRLMLAGIDGQRMRTIIRVVAEHFGLNPEMLQASTNRAAICRPRQIAMYLAKSLTTASLFVIGRMFGGKHHTTVLHAVRRVERRCATDLEYRVTVDTLRTAVGAAKGPEAPRKEDVQQAVKDLRNLLNRTARTLAVATAELTRLEEAVQQ
jgi:hypothetical protein